MSLRKYQTDCIAAIRENYAAGVRRQLVVLPTGSGKCCVAANLPLKSRTIFLVHRNELADQAFEKFRKYRPDATVGIEKAQSHASLDDDVVIGSVQTLTQRRLERWPRDHFRVVQIDEAHHSPSPVWLSILRHFRAMKGEPDCNEKNLVLGWTATPSRADSRGLEKVFDRIVFQKNVLEMIEANYLADVVAYRVSTMENISEVHTHSGDFAVGHLAATVNTPERNLLIVRKYQEYGEDHPALAFTVDIHHSHDLAERFQAEGISAYAVSGKTPKAERHRLVDAYRLGEIKALISCGVFNEGADFPIATVGLMARPTKSTLLYVQQLGRLLRCFPAPEEASGHAGYCKANAIILDFADNSGRHRVLNIATLFGLRHEFNAKGRSIRKIVRDIEKYESENPGLDLRSAASPEELRSIVEKIDLFRAPVIPAVVRRWSKFAWMEQADGTYHLALPGRQMLVVTENHLGQHEVYRSITGVRTLEYVAEQGLPEAFGVADNMVPRDALGLVLTTARWRKEEPSSKQVIKLFMQDRRLRTQFRDSDELYQFAMRRWKAGDLGWSRGGISERINSVVVARQ